MFAPDFLDFPSTPATSSSAAPLSLSEGAASSAAFKWEQDWLMSTMMAGETDMSDGVGEAPSGGDALLNFPFDYASVATAGSSSSGGGSCSESVCSSTSAVDSGQQHLRHASASDLNGALSPVSPASSSGGDVLHVTTTQLWTTPDAFASGGAHFADTLGAIGSATDQHVGLQNSSKFLWTKPTASSTLQGSETLLELLPAAEPSTSHAPSSLFLRSAMEQDGRKSSSLYHPPSRPRLSLKGICLPETSVDVNAPSNLGNDDFSDIVTPDLFLLNPSVDDGCCNAENLVSGVDVKEFNPFYPWPFEASSPRGMPGLIPFHTSCSSKNDHRQSNSASQLGSSNGKSGSTYGAPASASSSSTPSSLYGVDPAHFAPIQAQICQGSGGGKVPSNPCVPHPNHPYAYLHHQPLQVPGHPQRLDKRSLLQQHGIAGLPQLSGLPANVDFRPSGFAVVDHLVAATVAAAANAASRYPTPVTDYASDAEVDVGMYAPPHGDMSQQPSLTQTPTSPPLTASLPSPYPSSSSSSSPSSSSSVFSFSPVAKTATGICGGDGFLFGVPTSRKESLQQRRHAGYGGITAAVEVIPPPKLGYDAAVAAGAADTITTNVVAAVTAGAASNSRDLFRAAKPPPPGADAATAASAAPPRPSPQPPAKAVFAEMTATVLSATGGRNAKILQAFLAGGEAAAAAAALETKPSKRKKRRVIPKDTERYAEMRRKNNISSQKCRANRKQRAQIQLEHMQNLEAENRRLIGVRGELHARVRALKASILEGFVGGGQC